MALNCCGIYRASLRPLNYLRIAAVALIVTGASGYAQRALAVDETLFDDLRRRDERQEQDRLDRADQERRARERTPGVRLQNSLPRSGPVDLPQEQPCFTLQAIQLDGLNTKDFPWAQPLVDPYVGWCVGRAGINLLVKHVQQEFLARGWVTSRVYVPPQDLASATLTLKVVPGIIRSIRFADAQSHGSWVTAFPVRPGELLNLRDLEQGLEQMKRVPSQDIDMDLVPGDQPGDTDVVIKRRLTRPWRVFVSADDAGNDATGKYQGTLTLAADNLFGINDLFNATYGRDVSGSSVESGLRANSLYYSWPYGYWTFSLGLSESTYNKTIQGINQNFLLSGETQQYEARVHRIVHRSQQGKTGVQVRVVKRRLRSFIEDAEFNARDVSAVEPGINHHRFIGNTELEVQLSYPIAVSWLDATEDAPDPLPSTPTNRYRLWTFDANLGTPFTLVGREARYTMVLHAQTSNDQLFATEFIGIGNRYTVRGFDGQNTLAAERGWYIRNDIAVPLADSRQKVYLGVDHGQLGGSSSDQLVGKRITGAVVGVRGTWGELNYDLFAGTPLSKPSEFVTDNTTFGFMLTYRF